MKFALYGLSKITEALTTLILVSILIFAALRYLPGGYFDILLGNEVDQSIRDALSAKYGLNQPIAFQFVKWLTTLFHGDFGISLATKKPVLDEFLRRAPVTIELALLSTFVAVLVGVPLGILSALGDGNPLIRAGSRIVGALGASLPEFVLGSILLVVASNWALGFPNGGYVSLWRDPATNLGAMALPALSISVFGIALVLRTTRDAVRHVVTNDYITWAVARGDRPVAIVLRHVLRNASIPIVTVIATLFGYLLGGAVIAEVMFSLPGVGLYTFNALGNRDYAVVQAGVFLSAAIFIAINMVADLIYAAIDPRLAGKMSDGA